MKISRNKILGVNIYELVCLRKVWFIGLFCLRPEHI